jgi:hypothetical protein
VITAVPGATGVICPFAETVATAVSLEEYVKAPGLVDDGAVSDEAEAPYVN